MGHGFRGYENDRTREQDALAARHGGVVDVNSEAFHLLRDEFLRRWDRGVPISMMPQSRGALPYLMAAGLNQVLTQGCPTTANEVTLRQVMDATVRTGDGPTVVADALRRWIVVGGFQELAMTSNMGWDRAKRTTGTECRWAMVYDAWMRDERLSEKATGALWTALRDHAADSRVVDIITNKRNKEGFYGNPDFPVTPPTSYDMSEVETATVRLSDGEELEFQWALNGDGDDDEFPVAVYDWNAKLKHSATGQVNAYVGGTAYRSTNGKEGITPFQMIDAAEQYTATYEEALTGLTAVNDLACYEDPVVVIHYWERRDGAPKGVGSRCLVEAIRLCSKRLGNSFTCFVNIKPLQFDSAARNIGDCDALVLRLQSAERAVMQVLEHAVKQSPRLPTGIDLIWEETASYETSRRA